MNDMDKQELEYRKQYYGNLSDYEFQRMCVERVLNNDWDSHPIIDGLENHLFVKYSTAEDKETWIENHPSYDDGECSYEPNYYMQCYEVFKNDKLVGYADIDTVENMREWSN